MICRAREWVLDEMMTGEAIMHERKHKKIILTAICQAVQSVMGRSDTQYPSSIRKVTTSTINDVLHQWRDTLTVTSSRHSGFGQILKDLKQIIA